MKENHPVSVALDGPSGAGKSTVARAVAKRYHYIYVDTGAIYRTVGLAVRRAGLAPKDAEAVAALLPQLDISLRYDAAGVQRMGLNGEDVSEAIRTPEASRYASDVSTLPEVRAFLLNMQRELAKENSVIMDGRDIGTVVLPDAAVKIYLTASAEARARRRCAELGEKGIDLSYAEVLRDIRSRDDQDMHRAAAPLRKAEDAVEVDTSELDFDASVEAVCAVIREKTGQ